VYRVHVNLYVNNNNNNNNDDDNNQMPLKLWDQSIMLVSNSSVTWEVRCSAITKVSKGLPLIFQKKTWHTLQRGLSATAELLLNDGLNKKYCLRVHLTITA